MGFLSGALMELIVFEQSGRRPIAILLLLKRYSLISAFIHDPYFIDLIKNPTVEASREICRTHYALKPNHAWKQNTIQEIAVNKRDIYASASRSLSCSCVGKTAGWRKYE